MSTERVIYVMGVSGSGKSSVASMLAQLLSFEFADADDYHPKENIEKMRSGVPLDDSDRRPWLERLNKLALETLESNEGIVIACSCLKPDYRQVLQASIERQTMFVYLKGVYDVILRRMQERSAHFFAGESMLQSQFDTLIEPSSDEDINYLDVDIDNLNVEQVVELVESHLRKL